MASTTSDANKPRIPPPLPRRTTRNASPLPDPPPPPKPVRSVSVIRTPSQPLLSRSAALPPPLPARSRGVSNPVRSKETTQAQPIAGPSSAQASPVHVSVVSPSSGMPSSKAHGTERAHQHAHELKALPQTPQTPVHITAKPTPPAADAPATPQLQPAFEPILKSVLKPSPPPDATPGSWTGASPNLRQTPQDEHLKLASGKKSHAVTSVTDHPPEGDSESAGDQKTNLRWVQSVALLLLFLQLLGFKRFAFVAALGLAHFFYVWVMPRPSPEVPEPYPPPAAASESLVWINKTLKTLFPLISTDILTPFVDLLEDALMDQVPPIVTSVRVSSVSLGSEPVVLTGMRAISDDEWFASLTESKGHERSLSVKSIKDLVSSAAHAEPSSSKVKASPGPTPVAPGKTGRVRSTSNASGKASRRASDVEGSPSSVYVQNAVERARMRKRDKLINRVRGNRRRRRAQAEGSIMDDTAVSSESEFEGDEDEGHEDDQYINYEVSFAYRRTTDMRSRGTGLHMLAHFGWGVRGVGGSEIPVYIDVIELRGTIRVRILLSPSPPFAREASFSFVRMPYFDISARPLRTHGLGSFNAMDIPLLKTYIMKSIEQVAAAFVAPRHYRMDIERLLMGQDTSLRTRSIGVFYITIHECHGLPRADTMGSCDPYVAISYKMFNKPLFSTRTIVDTQDPCFEEAAFILVDAEAIEVGEKIRLRVCDSDRFSADDALGVVEVDVSDLVDKSTSTPGGDVFRRVDPLVSEHPGMRAQGEIVWSVRFFPLWQMPQDELEKRIQARRDTRGDGHTVPPWWLQWLEDFMEKPEWEKEREQRRHETREFFTGDRARDEIEAAVKPPADMSSGVLQFHIHQCNDLELESLAGTYSGSAYSRRKSAASGKPALNDVIDREPSENPDPPSAYCEVHLNDKYVYRTRTKQVNPMPYFNAVSERFVRDWRLAKIVFVIKDERDREHDPILGVVALRLKDVLKERTQFTRWFPLLGGLGWGRLRISLLFKPLDMRLPRGVSTYEACTFDLRSFTTVDLDPLLGGKHPGIIIETEHDRAVLHPPLIERSSTESTRLTNSSGEDSINNLALLSSDVDASGHNALQWEMPKPVRLAVKYRHSCTVLFTVATRRRLKKSKVHALAVLRLDDVPDSEEAMRMIPVFDTSSVKDAMKAGMAFSSHQAQPSSPPIMPSGVRLVGFIRLSFVVHPGVSRAHKKLCKRDFKFRSVYLAWEATRIRNPALTEQESKDTADDDEYDFDSDHSSDDDDHGYDDHAAAAAAEMHEDDTRAMTEGYMAHSKALHKKNLGIFQLKVARTGKFVKDKLEHKVIAATQGGRLHHRPHGADMEVEHEGQSRL